MKTARKKIPQYDISPFGLKIRDLRKAKGLSRKVLSGVSGVSASYIFAIEHGRRSKVSLEYKAKLFNALGVNTYPPSEESIEKGEFKGVGEERLAAQYGELAPEEQLIIEEVLSDADGRRHLLDQAKFWKFKRERS